MANSHYMHNLARSIRDETDTEREARIHAERIKRGILPPDPRLEARRGRHSIQSGAKKDPPWSWLSACARTCPPEAAGFDPAAYDALALDLAQLHTSAWLDEEIKRHFALQDLDDEEALYVILALAQTLH